MKNSILILTFLFGFLGTSLAQNPCGVAGMTVGFTFVSIPPSSIAFTNTSTPATGGNISSCYWQICQLSSGICLATSGQTNPTFNIVCDTIIACLTVTSIVNFLSYSCTFCDTLYYDSITGWSSAPAPLVINEFIPFSENDNRYFDILGREFSHYNAISKGALYIRNNRKFIKY